MAFFLLRSVRVCYQETAVADHRKSSAGHQLFHRLLRGFELDTTHPVIASALKGAARSHAEVGNKATVRRPVSWATLLAGETLIPAWRSGERVLWLALYALFWFWTHPSEMFAETRSRIHETCCLRRADVAFFRGRAQLRVWK